MSKNKKIVLIIVGIIVLVGVFYAGMSYGKSSSSVASSVTGAGIFTGQFGANRGVGRAAGGGLINGKIISKDADSITIQIMNINPTSATTATQSGSKIVFLDTSTPITKTTFGTISDLITGKEVLVTGTTNTDGSVTANSIQIRPQTATAKQ